MKFMSRLGLASLRVFALLLQGLAKAPVKPVDSIDLGAYAALRAEGLDHSQVMTFASDLMDGIGARLMWSPNMAKAIGPTSIAGPREPPRRTTAPSGFGASRRCGGCIRS
jgi:hypothetical protein